MLPLPAVLLQITDFAKLVRLMSWACSQRERQVQREEAQELTEKLDQDWKNIQSLMVKKTPKADKQEEKPKVGIHK